MDITSSTRIFALVLTLLSSLAHTDTITLVADRWYPYNGTPQSPKPGYMIEIAKFVFGQAGHTIQYQLMSWDRALRLTREGKKNCVVGSYKSEAPDFVFPNSHQGVDQNIIIKRSDDEWLYAGPQSLKNIRLGAIAGYDYTPSISDYINQHKDNPDRIKITRGRFPLEQNLLALINGELGAVVGSSEVVSAAIEKQHWENDIAIAGKVGDRSKLYIACSPAIQKSQAYADLLTTGMKHLRKTGELNNILARYGLKDWQGITAIDN